jgi:hypothetical protein
MSCTDSTVPVTTKFLRLRVTAEPDPGALSRVLANFQNINLLPRRVIAEFGSSNELHVTVDLVDLSEHRLTCIAAKVAQIPSVLQAYWHYV